MKRCLAALMIANAALADVLTTTQGISVQLAPAAKLSVPASVALSGTPASFLPYSGTLPVSFRVRSTPSGGGTVTLQVTSDFLPAGGPAAAAGVLTYTCSGSTLGTACTGRQTASTSAQTPVVSIPPAACTGGGGPCSAADPNLVQIDLWLENEPGFATGSYSAQLTFVISSL